MPIEIPAEKKVELERHLESMLIELDRRKAKCVLLASYLDGNAKPPEAIVRANVTRVYRNLMPVSDAPWASLIVDSTLDRLEVSGIDSGDKVIDQQTWGIWQDNQMDSESKLGHISTLVDGRSFALVWPDEDDKPLISLDDAATMIVRYAEGSRRRRIAALRRWLGEDGKEHVTLYLPDEIYKFSEEQAGTEAAHRVKAGGKWWMVREEPDEEWPLENPYGVVPVVEIPINRRLRPGCYPFARGEYEHCIGLIDRINLLTFLGLVVAFWMGFPLRGVVGEKIMRDDDGNPIAPFGSKAGEVFQFEKSEVKLHEFKAADRGNLSIFAEVDQLAAITKTPRHYFPIEGGFANINADTIRASEGGLHAKISGYKPTTGENWVEVLRIAMLMEGASLSPRTRLRWKDHHSRSLTEQADSASKLKDILPWQILAEKCLNLSQEEISKAEAQRTVGVFDQLLAEAANGESAERGEVEPVAA